MKNYFQLNDLAEEGVVTVSNNVVGIFDKQTNAFLYACCNLTPIKLGDVVLSKIGFTRYNGVHFYDDKYCWVYPNSNLMVFLRNDNIYRINFNGVDDNPMFFPKECELKYVHELQQILRMYGKKDVAEMFIKPPTPRKTIDFEVRDLCAAKCKVGHITSIIDTENIDIFVDNNLYKREDITPIPIDDDFMRRNGLGYNSHQMAWTIKDYNGEVNIQKTTDDAYGWWIKEHNGGEYVTYIRPISYIHELQHILRLNNMNIIADNLKA